MLIRMAFKIFAQLHDGLFGSISQRKEQRCKEGEGPPNKFSEGENWYPY